MTGRRIVLPGGTGFLGRHLAARLRTRDAEVVILTRGAQRDEDGIRYVHWDGRTVGPWAAALEGADAVINCTGERVDRRPTRGNIALLTRSRVEPTRAVGAALASLDDPPQAWIQLGTLAIYGDAGLTPLDESVPVSGVGPPQMVQVGLAWERAFSEAAAGVRRQVQLRLGVTMGGHGDPATAQLARLHRLGLGGRIGTGSQMVSWIALLDAMRAVEHVLDDDEAHGTYHVCAPTPVDNRTMQAILRDLLGVPFGLPAPAPAVQIGAWLMGTDPALALTGRRGVPDRLLDAGFRFEVTEIRQALAQALDDAGIRRR